MERTVWSGDLKICRNIPKGGIKSFLALHECK